MLGPEIDDDVRAKSRLDRLRRARSLVQGGVLRTLYAYGLSIGLMWAVVSPAFRDPPEDSFPFSDYPMFSHGRPTPMLTITQALGVRPGGERVPLPPMISSGNREVMQSMRSITIGLRANPTRYCAEVAERAAADEDFADVAFVEIATSTWDTVRYFEEGSDPIERRVHQRCRVPR